MLLEFARAVVSEFSTQKTFETCTPGLASNTAILNSSTLRMAAGAGLTDLAQVVSEPIFDIPRLVEAARHQRFDPILGGRSPERSNARIPPRAELDVGWQAGVDETLGVGDRPFVKPRDPGRERVDERVQIGV